MAVTDAVDVPRENALEPIDVMFHVSVSNIIEVRE